MPNPTKLDMKIHLRNMIDEKKNNYRDDDSKLFEVALDIACLNRCLALVEATMPEQMDNDIDHPVTSDLVFKDAHKESLRES